MTSMVDFKKNYHQTYFRKLMLFSAQFILLILFITILTCVIFCRNILKSQDSACRLSVSNSAASLQSDMTMFQNMSYLMMDSLSYENRVMFYKTDSSQIINQYDLMKVRNNLGAVKNIHPAIRRIALYAPVPKLMITDNGLYRENDYYNLYPQYLETDTAAIESRSALDYYSAASGTDLTLCVSCVDFYGVNAFLLFSLDRSYLVRAIQTDIPVDQAYSVLADISGTAFLCSDPDFSPDYYRFIEEDDMLKHSGCYRGTKVIRNQTMRVYSKDLDYFNWRIYYFIPQTQFLRPVYRFVAAFLIGDLLLILLCLFAACYFSNILYQPISRLVGLVGGGRDDDSTEEFNLITKTFDSLRRERNELKNQLSDWSAPVQNSILRKMLLYGDTSVEKSDISVMLSEAGVSMPQPYSLIVLLNFYYKPSFFDDFLISDQKLLFQKLPDMVKQIICQPFDHTWMFDLEEFRYAVIINTADENCDTRVSQLLYQFYQLLEEDGPYLHFSFALSGKEPDFTALIHTFKSLNRQSQYYLLDCSDPRVSVKTCDYQKNCVIPENLDENIRAALVGGNQALLSDIIRSVFEANFSRSATPYRIQKINTVFFELYENLAEIAVPQNSGYRSSLYLYLYDKESNCIFIQRMFSSLLNSQVIQQDANRNELLHYIDVHYSDPDLDLQKMAEQFHFNVNYLSRLFKKQTGTNFSDYLCNVRIKEAMGIIETTDILIDDVARAVGIVNRRTFNRLFKKAAGVSPAMYRLLHKG